MNFNKISNKFNRSYNHTNVIKIKFLNKKKSVLFQIKYYLKGNLLKNKIKSCF